jgi:outer membrane protein TolC
MIPLLIIAQIDSLSLKEVLDIALSQSPAYHESRVSLDKSRIQFYQAFSNLLPAFSATGQYTGYENNNYGTNSFDIISSILAAIIN